MPSNDSYDLREQVAGLRSDVRHIQGDVTDIKAELRTTNQRIDELKDRVNEGNVKLTASLNAAKFWAIGLLGTLLCLLGRVFKWF